MVAVTRTEQNKSSQVAHKDPTVNEVAGGQRTLHKGHEGKSVEHVQGLLSKRGHKVATDGDFGPKTERAVKAFQRNHDLPPTGRVDHRTLDKLERGNVHHKDEFMERGDHNPHVKRVETQLHRLGYDTGPMDGKYDAKTAAAVKDFKHDEGIQGGGHALNGAQQKQIRRSLAGLNHDPQRTRHTPDRAQKRERTRLDAATKAAAESTTTASPFAPTPFGASPFAGVKGIGEGSSPRVVKNVQAHLRSAGFDPKHVNGKFDERTETAVRAFQRHSDLPVTGRVDGRTWNKLEKSQFIAKDGTSPAQSIGERSQAVLHTERLLKKLDLHPGKVDGVFDRHTQAASRRFERRNGHVGDDGEVGKAQVQAMEKAVKKKEAPNLNTVAGCAKFLLQSKNVSYSEWLSTGSERANLQRLAQGKDALVQTPDSVSDRTIKPKLQVMQALVAMAKNGPIEITAITGGDHSSGSNHYSGNAIDLSTGVGSTSDIVRIGARFGGVRNYERTHIHMDF